MCVPLLRPALATSAIAAAFCALAPAARAGDVVQARVGAEVAPPGEDAATRARSRYEAGTQAFSQGRYVEAALDFEAAAAEKASPIALYTAAMSWERANAPERAADDYRRALSIGGLAAESSAQASQRLAALEAVLGTVVVTAPDGWRAQVDAYTELPLPAMFHAAAGVHTLTFRPVGRPIGRLPVVVQAGASTRVDLPRVEAQPAPTVEAPPPRRSGDARPTIGFIALGAGGAALLSGALLGVESLDARNAYDAGPTSAAYATARNLQLWTNVALIAGGTLLAGGLVLVLWPSPHGPAGTARPAALGLAVGPSSLGLRGGF
jgi:hypothetical protein